MAEHTKNARGSTHDKHTKNHDSMSEKKREHDTWVQKGVKKEEDKEKKK